MGELTEALNSAGFVKEKSTAGDKPIFEGVYKATFVEFGEPKDNGYGPSCYGAFKISEVLLGRESNSQFPEFKGYFNTAPDKIASKRSGLAKLINGLFSVGIEADADNLADQKGAEVYISAYKQKVMKKEGDGFVAVEGEFKQGWTFLTEKNALKAVEKAAKKGDAPF